MKCSKKKIIEMGLMHPSIMKIMEGIVRTSYMIKNAPRGCAGLIAVAKQLRLYTHMVIVTS